MFVVFNWGYVTKKKLGPTFPVKCFSCNNKAYMNLIRHREWIGLFGIPCIPSNSMYYLACNYCTCGSQVFGKKQIKNVLKLNKATSAYLNNTITAEEYKILLRKNPMFGQAVDAPGFELPQKDIAQIDNIQLKA